MLVKWQHLILFQYFKSIIYIILEHSYTIACRNSLGLKLTQIFSLPLRWKMHIFLELAQMSTGQLFWRAKNKQNPQKFEWLWRKTNISGVPSPYRGGEVSVSLWTWGQCCLEPGAPGGGTLGRLCRYVKVEQGGTEPRGRVARCRCVCTKALRLFADPEWSPAWGSTRRRP